MHQRIKDNLREQMINGLLSFLEDDDYTQEERKIINQCASLLINKRSPDVVADMEKRKFGKSFNG